MNSKRKIKVWRISVFILLFAFACGVYAYQDDVKSIIREIFESKWSIALVSIYSVVAVVTHRIFIEGSGTRAGFAYTHFGKYADSLLAIGTYVLASTTSIALLKGLFMQIIFSQTFFSGFDRLDLISILVVSSFLLYYCLLNTTKLLVEVVSQVDAAAVSKTDPTQ